MENVLKLKAIKEQINNDIEEQQKDIYKIDSQITLKRSKITELIGNSENLEAINKKQSEIDTLENKLRSKKIVLEKYIEAKKTFLKRDDIRLLCDDVHAEIEQELERLKESSEENYKKIEENFRQSAQFVAKMQENYQNKENLINVYNNIVSRNLRKPFKNNQIKYRAPCFEVVQSEYYKATTDKKERPGWMKAQEHREQKEKKKLDVYTQQKINEAKKYIKDRKNNNAINVNVHKNALNAWYWG